MDWTVWGSQNPGGGKIFLPLSRLTLGLTWRPIHWVPGLFPGMKLLGHDIIDSHPSSAKIKESGAIPILPPLGLHGMLWGQLYLFKSLAMQLLAVNCSNIGTTV